MKIDIHVHTKKVKSGDAPTRSIDSTRFGDIIRATDVRVLAVTNHNHFDHEQYLGLRESVEGVCQVWPGVELDIMEDGKRAHVLVIVSPTNVDAFSDVVKSLLGSTNPDVFTIGLEDTVRAFAPLNPLYIAHYHSKKPNLLNKDVARLISLSGNDKRVLKEASNAISAGIFISHGHNSIYGSDVQDWDDYVAQSVDLPELRLPVESFEQFLLLLDKDAVTINTLLDKKSKERIQLNPFGVAELVDIDIYNDVNVVFGSKGTGKSQILNSLSRYYNERGYRTKVYASNEQHISTVYDLSGTNLSVDAQTIGVSECVDEISLVRSATETDITSISAYTRYYATEETNRIARSIRVSKLSLTDSATPERAFEGVRAVLVKAREFHEYAANDRALLEIIGPELSAELINSIGKVIDKVKAEAEVRVLDFKSVLLFNHLIDTLSTEIARKTGQPSKPGKTGFHDYASNRIRIERSVQTILANLAVTITPHIQLVGSLGEKGELKCQTDFRFQNGSFVDGSFRPFGKIKKTPQKKFAASLHLVSKNIYSSALFEKIAELNELEEVEEIDSLMDLLQFNRYFTLEGFPYSPSNGESSMVLLHNELTEDKEIYLIDEPEKSLGNDYISDVIVPLLKEKSKLGKRVIVATHDANIAVRTLPYNTVYRLHEMNRYYTYAGNPFSNSLVCSEEQRPRLDWKEVSMKTLEGGRGAFGERGKIYGGN